jgi:hypothetical protein
MYFKSEANGLQIGVNNSVTEAFSSGKWGVRLTFTDNDFHSKYEVVFPVDEAKSLIRLIQESIDSINVVKTKTY